jgi:hypothetical protein
VVASIELATDRRRAAREATRESAQEEPEASSAGEAPEREE